MRTKEADVLLDTNAAANDLFHRCKELMCRGNNMEQIVKCDVKAMIPLDSFMSREEHPDGRKQAT